MDKNKSKTAIYKPRFRLYFLKPKYWWIWFIFIMLFLLSKIPGLVLNYLLKLFSATLYLLARRLRKRAEINLLKCMPELTYEEKRKIICDMFYVGLQSTATLFSLRFQRKNINFDEIRWHGYDIIKELRNKGDNVILIVPHMLAMEILGLALGYKGINIAAMVRLSGNEVIDYLVNLTRQRFNLQIHSNDAGVNSFIL